MAKYESDAVRVIQLSVLSALVDGNASPEEIDAIAAGASEHLKMDAAGAKTLATQMIERYVSKELASDPIAVIRHGKNAMRRLSGRQRKVALEIATKVAAATAGGEAVELRFLRQLAAIARA